MKKQTKIIACLLAGLTLTACVGSVNVPADTEKTAEREARAIDPVPSAPQIDVGRGYYIGTLTSSQSVFKNVTDFRIDVDFDNRTLTGGDSYTRSATPASSFSVNGYRTRADFNYACGIAINTAKADFNTGSRCVKSARPATEQILELTGTFTPRGVISGSVSYEYCAPTCPRFGDTANLTGTINKQRIVGRFSGDFSGGFTVNRR